MSRSSTGSPSLRRLVTFDLRDASLADALAEITRQTGVEFGYQSQLLAGMPRITLSVTEVAGEDAAQRVLRGTGLRMGARTATLVSLVADIRVRADGAVLGKVVNGKTKQAIAGATILVDNATKGILTSEDGGFRLSLSAGSHAVAVRAVGFIRQTRQITITEGQTATIDFVLEPSASVLDEVVVTGTVVATERKAIPNPITVITAEDIQKRGITRVEQLFRGEVPGVLAQDVGSKRYDGGSLTFGNVTLGAMASTQVYVRGASQLSSTKGNPFKTYIDGVEILDPSYLGTIDPQSIERIEIITGPQAATIYGSGAMGGVMQVFTKKGNGRSTPDLTLGLRYGVLNNSMSNGLTPQHAHTFNVAGGLGAGFSYSGTLSYNYTGQWQPDLFSQSYGASVGATHTRGPVTVSGSFSTTAGRNGTASDYGYAWFYNGWQSGELLDIETIRFRTQRTSTSASQTAGLDLDYRPYPIWSHHITLGKNVTTFTLNPAAPMFANAADTLFLSASSTGGRTTASYNTTIAPAAAGILSSTLTLGANGSSGDQTRVSGCLARSTSTSFVNCQTYYGGSFPISVSRPLDTESWGAFGSWRLGLFEHFYLTLGLRAERNPTYGRAHKIDWTPTNGLTYSMDIGDLTVKFLGSYGRATRPPSADMRLAVMSTSTTTTPGQYLSQLEAPDLTPEYSRGPQGGVELYYGSVGSLTINHYTQKVTDLIQSARVDSITATVISTGLPRQLYQNQYQNIASIRQYGWEITGSAALGALSAKGTYSWTDSRIIRSNSTYYTRGFGNFGIPTHTASMSVTYAAGNTSATLTTNYIGGFTSGQSSLLTDTYYYSRLGMYISRASSNVPSYWREAAATSDLAAAQRIRPWASLTLNVTNLQNRFQSDVSARYPTLGRQTMIGVSLRYPPNR